MTKSLLAPSIEFNYWRSGGLTSSSLFSLCICDAYLLLVLFELKFIRAGNKHSLNSLSALNSTNLEFSACTNIQCTNIHLTSLQPIL